MKLLFVHNYCNYTKKLKKRVEKLLSFNLTHFWLFINLSGTLKHFIFVLSLLSLIQFKLNKSKHYVS